MPDFTWSMLLDFSTIPGALTLAVVIAAVATVSSRVLTKIMENQAKWVIGHLRRKVDETIVRYMVRLKTLLVALAGVMLFVSLVPQLRALMSTMLAGAGITALVVGLAAKPTLSNLVSGVAIAAYRPFRIGDKLLIDGESCMVEDITLRHTIVKTWQNRRLIIPNEKIDGMIISNYTIVEERMLCTVEVGVSYDTDIDLARQLMLGEADRCPHRQADGPEPWVRVVELGEYAVVLRIYLWTENIDESWLARFWLLEHVKKRFDAAGVEIPFPYRTVVYKKDLPPAKVGAPAPPSSEI